MTTVTVFAFKVYHITDDVSISSQSKATLENIRTIPNATAIPDTGEQVDESQLDGNGSYYARAPAPPTDPELREEVPETGSSNDPDLGQMM